jgi:hypothetical protein
MRIKIARVITRDKVIKYLIPKWMSGVSWKGNRIDTYRWLWFYINIIRTGRKE